jgi:hypothetical protein
MAVYANIPIDQGSDFSTVVTVTGANGLVFDLTGYLVRGQIRKTYTSLTAVSFAASIKSAAEGQISLALTAVQTAAMKPGRYLYDVEIVHIATSVVTRVVEGQIEINPRITQPA